MTLDDERQRLELAIDYLYAQLADYDNLLWQLTEVSSANDRVSSYGADWTAHAIVSDMHQIRSVDISKLEADLERVLRLAKEKQEASS